MRYCVHNHTVNSVNRFNVTAVVLHYSLTITPKHQSFHKFILMTFLCVCVAMFPLHAVGNSRDLQGIPTCLYICTARGISFFFSGAIVIRIVLSIVIGIPLRILFTHCNSGIVLCHRDPHCVIYCIGVALYDRLFPCCPRLRVIPAASG